jgi:hypothetical protein
MNGRDDPLPPLVRRHFTAPRHAGEPGAAATGAAAAMLVAGEAGAREQGTWIRLSLRLAAGRIVAAAFQAYGCPYTLATCDWLAGRLADRPLADPGLGGPRDWAQALGVPEQRLARLLVLEDALQAALRNARPDGYNSA